MNKFILSYIDKLSEIFEYILNIGKRNHWGYLVSNFFDIQTIGLGKCQVFLLTHYDNMFHFKLGMNK